jgi:hypothetical protein
MVDQLNNSFDMNYLKKSLSGAGNPGRLASVLRVNADHRNPEGEV